MLCVMFVVKCGFVNLEWVVWRSYLVTSQAVNPTVATWLTEEKRKNK